MILEARDPQAKDALERSHRFMRSNFEPGRVFANHLDFQDRLDAWTDKANARAHRTVRAVPAGRRVEVRVSQTEALNPEGIVLGAVNGKAQGIDGTTTIMDIERAGMLDGNAGYPVRALLDGVVPDGVASVIVRYLSAPAVNARVVNNVLILVPRPDSRGISSIAVIGSEARSDGDAPA